MTFYAWTCSSENLTFWTDSVSPTTPIHIYDSNGNDVTNTYTGDASFTQASSSQIIFSAAAKGCTLPILGGDAKYRVDYAYTRNPSLDILDTQYVSNLSDGTNTYVIKDSEARTTLSGKQDTLVSGTNIKTVNNTSLLGSGNVSVGTVTSVNNVSPTNGNVSLSIPTVNNATLTITQGGTTKGTFTANASSNVTIDLDSGGSVDVDNKSITTNSSDEIQTVGVINSRDSSTAIKTWTGTKAQYDAIVSKDSSTLYNITDDTDVTLTLLEALYPVGSIYITTAASCPLATLISGSTWTLQSSAIVTSVNTNVPIKGNGMTLGLTDGTTNVGLGNGSSSSYGGHTTTENYGKNVGTGMTGSFTPTGKTLGITTDASKSGIVGTVTRSTLSVNIFERTA